MIKKLRLWLMRVWRWYRQRTLYVIADATDNSITFSRNLFDLLDVMGQDEAKVYVFRLCNAVVEEGSKWNGRLYAFTINPPFGQETQLADIQYNAKHKCIGFESLCPTVNQIFYDYGLPHNTKAKLSVHPSSVNGDNPAVPIDYYLILPPHDNTPA